MTQSTKDGRVLTIEQLNSAHACWGGMRRFRARWGKSAVVNQEWAREAAEIFEFGDATWAAKRLLPRGWVNIYDAARSPYCSPIRTDDATWCRISFAVFAALYVEAGKP